MKVITIGRNSKNDVKINDRNVSNHHLQIIQTDKGDFKLVDLDSTNGTYINGNRVKGEIKIKLSDIIRIGNTILPWNTYFSTKLE